MEVPPPSSIAQIGALYSGKSLQEKLQSAKGLFPITPPNTFLYSSSRDVATSSSGTKTDFNQKNIIEGHRILQGQLMYPFQNKIELQYSKVDPFFYNGTIGDPNATINSNLIGTPLGADNLEDPRMTYVKNLLIARQLAGKKNVMYDDYLRQLYMFNTEKGANYYTNQLALLDQDLVNYKKMRRSLINNPIHPIVFSKQVAQGKIGRKKSAKRKVVQFETDFATMKSNPRSSKFMRADINKDVSSIATSEYENDLDTIETDEYMTDILDDIDDINAFDGDQSTITDQFMPNNNPFVPNPERQAAAEKIMAEHNAIIERQLKKHEERMAYKNRRNPFAHQGLDTTETPEVRHKHLKSEWKDLVEKAYILEGLRPDDGQSILDDVGIQPPDQQFTKDESFGLDNLYGTDTQADDGSRTSLHEKQLNRRKEIRQQFDEIRRQSTDMIVSLSDAIDRMSSANTEFVANPSTVPQVLASEQVIANGVDYEKQPSPPRTPSRESIISEVTMTPSTTSTVLNSQGRRKLNMYQTPSGSAANANRIGGTLTDESEYDESVKTWSLLTPNDGQTVSTMGSIITTTPIRRETIQKPPQLGNPVARKIYGTRSKKPDLSIYPIDVSPARAGRKLARASKAKIEALRNQKTPENTMEYVEAQLDTLSKISVAGREKRRGTDEEYYR